MFFIRKRGHGVLVVYIYFHYGTVWFKMAKYCSEFFMMPAGWQPRIEQQVQSCFLNRFLRCTIIVDILSQEKGEG